MADMHVTPTPPTLHHQEEEPKIAPNPKQNAENERRKKTKSPSLRKITRKHKMSKFQSEFACRMILTRTNNEGKNRTDGQNK